MFKIGDIIVGKESANEYYTVTRAGVKCLVTDVREYLIRVHVIGDNSFPDFAVDPILFELVASEGDETYDAYIDEETRARTARLERERAERAERARIAAEEEARRREEERLARIRAEEERKRKEAEKAAVIAELISESERRYLINNIGALLDRFGYQWRTGAINKIIDEWAYNKADIIRHFKKHPNYLEGKFMIAFSANYDREIDFEVGRDFYNWLHKKADLLEDGSKFHYDTICCLDDLLNRNHSRTVTERNANNIKRRLDDAVHIHEGEKTTRAVGKLCQYIGFDKIKIMETNPVSGRERDIGYNKQFAIYSDAMSPLQIVRHTILSISPMDYLTMSFGNSWASCHTIDKANIRNSSGTTYEGMYSSGTISYMLDPSSMVLYTVDGSYDGNEFWNEDKIIRQMFHWGAEKLIQGRLYPQSNDGYKDTYKPYREIVQKLVSEMWDFPNRWMVSKNMDGVISDCGTHYHDYTHYYDCTISRIRDNENEDEIHIGHEPICVYCGDEHNTEDSIDCCHDFAYYICADCGCAITSEDDVYYVDGEAYCRDCVSYCDNCDSWYRNSECVEVHSGRWPEFWCPDCVERYATRCGDCGEYYENDMIHWIDCAGRYVCADCIDDYSYCEDCCEYYPNEEVTVCADEQCRCRDCTEQFESAPARILI